MKGLGVDAYKELGKQPGHVVTHCDNSDSKAHKESIDPQRRVSQLKCSQRKKCVF